MKVGMEHDPVEDLDREEERTIAALISARISKGDIQAAKRAVEAVSIKRQQLRSQRLVRQYG